MQFTVCYLYTQIINMTNPLNVASSVENRKSPSHGASSPFGKGLKQFNQLESPIEGFPMDLFCRVSSLST